MDNYRVGPHTRYSINYHFVWVVKYRKAALRGEVAKRVREVTIEVCKANDIEILGGHVSKDHVHLFVSAPPHLSPSKIMQYVKGKTSRKLMMEFDHIQKTFWGRHMWARGYFVATSGNVTDDVILEYIRLQQEGEPKGAETFRIEEGG